MLSLDCDGMQNASLAQSLNSSGLVATVFAPTNDAFAAAQTQLGLSQAQIAGHPEILSQVIRRSVIDSTYIHQLCACFNLHPRHPATTRSYKLVKENSHPACILDDEGVFGYICQQYVRAGASAKAPLRASQGYSHRDTLTGFSYH